MPNRIIKESVCVSEQIDQLTPFEEVFFYRLLVNCDDYGCFDARERVVSSRLFPLRDIKTSEIAETLKRLETVGLIRLYTVGGKPFLHVCTWANHQRLRVSKHKYPMPEDADGCRNLPQLAANRAEILPESESESESEYESESESLSDNAAAGIAREHDQVIEAAERAGFPRTDAIRAKLIDLYSLHGLQKMLDGINACVDYGVTTIAYLTAVLRGEPKKPKKTVTAQKYEQRDYDDEQEAAFRRMLGTG